MGRKKNKIYRKKSKFHGNRFTHKRAANECASVVDIEPDFGRPAEQDSCSQQTFSTPPNPKRLRVDESSTSEPDNYFILINFSILKDIISSVGTCVNCGGGISLVDVTKSRMGLAHQLKLFCNDCEWECQQFTSQSSKPKETGGRSFYEANIRMVIAFREIGKGHEGIRDFLRVMNMYGLSWPAYENIKKDLIPAYEIACTSSMKKAAYKVHNENHNKLPTNPSIKLCDISIDGTWQKRGHNSLNGVVTGICSDLCIDKHVMSKYCRLCQQWDPKKGTQSYNKWKETHTCKKNHAKSSGKMESSGALAIFTSSVEKHNLIYENYIGDGDTSSFRDICEANPYKDYGILPSKLECIGHIQKRLGTRLRELRKSHTGTHTPLSGRGRLTDKVINSLQNFYGQAIRENQGNLYAMKKAVGAILWHCTDFGDDEKGHQYCPRSPSSWCKYQKDKVLDTKKYKKSINLPIWIHKILRPIFEDLSKDELLSRCLHGKIQNSNEALNSLIWKKCPKSVFVEKDTLECAVHSAILSYNEGPCALTDVFSYFGFKTGIVTAFDSDKKRKQRNRNIARKMSNEGKKRRKCLRSLKKGFVDKEKEQEGGDSYIPGGF